MTEITDEETAEVLWASSDQGDAAVRAAWDKAKALGLGTRAVGNADVGAIVYAAYLAAGWDGDAAGPEPAGCGHQWTILGTQPHTPFVVIGSPPPYTRVLIRCDRCGEPDARTLPGEWTLEDLQGTTGA